MYRNFEVIISRAKEIGLHKVAILFPDNPQVLRATVLEVFTK